MPKNPRAPCRVLCGRVCFLYLIYIRLDWLSGRITDEPQMIRRYQAPRGQQRRLLMNLHFNPPPFCLDTPLYRGTFVETAFRNIHPLASAAPVR